MNSEGQNDVAHRPFFGGCDWFGVGRSAAGRTVAALHIVGERCGQPERNVPALRIQLRCWLQCVILTSLSPPRQHYTLRPALPPTGDSLMATLPPDAPHALYSIQVASSAGLKSNVYVQRTTPASLPPICIYLAVSEAERRRTPNFLPPTHTHSHPLGSTSAQQHHFNVGVAYGPANADWHTRTARLGASVGGGKTMAGTWG